MRRLSPYLSAGLGLAVFIIYSTTQNPDPKQEWARYIQNHPYSQKVDLKELEGMPKQDRPDLAMQQNFLMTMDPRTREVPVDRLVEAFQRQKSIRAAGRMADAISGVSWEERGPNNVGGRTRALMWDPNDENNEKLWAAGVAGGIWFNNDVTDVNSSWQNVNDFMANLAVTTLAYDPANTQVFYAGTGEGYFNGGSVRGAGIFKSTDGGANWSQIASTANSTFNYVQRVVVTSSGIVFASTRDGGVQRSTDNGVSWSNVLTDGAASNRANDLEIAANGDIYASFGIFSDGSIYRSSDDGETWTNITPSGGTPQRIELAVAPSASSETESTIIYAVASFSSDVEWFKRSEDGGETWSDITIPKYRSQNCSESSDDFTRGQAWYDLSLAVHSTNPDVVLAGGINVVRSDDGGSTMAEVSYWTGGCDSYVHADIHNIVFRPGNPNEAVISSDGGISYSTNVGSSSDPTFNDRNKDYNVTQFYATAAQNSVGVDYFIAGAQDNGTQLFTAANGLSTVAINGGDGAFCFIDQDDNNFQITSYIYNWYDLHNAAGAFQENLVSNQSQGRFINPADYDNEADILYSAGNQNQLMRIDEITGTPNSQETIDISLNGGQISAIRADANTENRIFIGTGFGEVFRVENANGSPSLVNITSNISTGGYISSIDIGASDDELIVTFSNYGVISVWYTDDGGSTWDNKDNDGSLPDIPVRWALFNPNNTQEVMLATELGVWSTSDITSATPGWEQSSDNLANVRCDMLQHRTSDNLVLVATHGRGLFSSDGAFDGLAAPTDLEISQDSEFVTLNWTDNSVDEDSYVVERSIGNDQSFEVIDELDPDSETFTEAIPATNQLIFYRVYGTSLLEEDSRSIEGSLLSLPGIPVFGEVTNVNTREFTINWTVEDDASVFFLDISESDDFSSFISGYEGRVVEGLTTTITDRASGTYHFRVAANNASGNSDYSTTGTVTLDPLSVFSEEVVCYPNPTSGDFFVAGVTDKASFEVINVLGQVQPFRYQINGTEASLDISELANGSYTLKINSQSGSITKTIVKK